LENWARTSKRQDKPADTAGFNKTIVDMIKDLLKMNRKAQGSAHSNEMEKHHQEDCNN
jgi:hypothetical protein